MTRELWNTTYCTLWKTSRKLEKVCDLPMGSLLLDAGMQDNGCTRVIYLTPQTFTGWVDSSVLDEVTYVLRHDVVLLDHPTASRQDPNQYIFIDGKLEYNLCGPICICDAAGISLSALLQLWKAYPTNWFSKVFLGGIIRPTGIPDLKNMLDALPMEYWNLPILFSQGSKIVMTPARIASVLKDGWKIIVSVHINHAGRLQPTGTLHWVEIVDATPNGINNGWIDCFNPAPNADERYDFGSFSASMGIPCGLLVRKK